MSATDFFAASRVLVVAGKGGVGKTTVGATIGVAAAAGGLDVLLVELEGRSNLAAPFGVQLDYESTLLEESDGGGRLRGRRLTPDEALRDYLDASGLGRLADRRAVAGSVEVVTTTAPGIRDLLVLGKIRQLEEAGEADLIVVDAPAAGHAVTFLQAASGLLDASASGPVQTQAEQVHAMLGDERRCRVVLVTTPEETPISETVEVAYDLEERCGVTLGPLVVNRCWAPVAGLEQAVAQVDPDSVDPALLTAAAFRLDRLARQANGLDRLDRNLPLPRLDLPLLVTDRLDRPDLGLLAEALVSQLEREPV